MDQWNEKLLCPRCNKSGMASLSQADDAPTPTVDAVAVGFKVIPTQYGPDFRCADCNVPVQP
jgi:hypothetical protein